MTLTKKAMQVASIHGPASKGKKTAKLGGPNYYYRKSEAKPILKELEEEKKVLNRTKSEIKERIDNIKNEQRVLHESSNSLVKKIWLPKVFCIFSPYQFYDKYVAIIEKLV